MNNHITIKEFATLANVTTQAVYKRLNQSDGQMNEFVKMEGKIKLISKEALKLFADYKTVENVANEEKKVETELNSNIEKLKSETVDILFKQLETKDTQIGQLIDSNKFQYENMKSQLDMKDKQIIELQKLLDQQQQLHRQEQENIKLLTVDETAKNKKGIFKKLFKKNKVELQY